jgi:hypothetical protein
VARTRQPGVKPGGAGTIDRAPVLIAQGHVAKFALVRGPARHPPQTWSLKARPRGRAQEMLQERLPKIPVNEIGPVRVERPARSLPVPPKDAPTTKAGAVPGETPYRVFKAEGYGRTKLEEYRK